MTSNVLGVPVILASLTLVGAAVAIAAWLRLGISRDIVSASVRAAIQLLAVGYLLTFVVETSAATVLAWTWVGAMIVVSAIIVRRSAAIDIPTLGWAALLAVGGSTGLSLVVVFGFGLFDFDAVTLIVTAGITIGNALPSAVLAADQVTTMVRDHRSEIEGLLSLGCGRSDVSRYLGPRTARAAMIPQVERTKVVGLIALPGAMVGLLLAGVDPIEAVVIQLLVMYLVLGAVAISVIAVVVVLSRHAVTADLRAATWSPTTVPRPTGRRQPKTR